MATDPDHPDRLIINTETREVWLDGRRYENQHLVALRVLEFIAARSGRWVSHRELETIPGCKGDAKHFRRILDHLHPELSALVIGQRGPGGGYSLKLPSQGQVTFRGN